MLYSYVRVFLYLRIIFVFGIEFVKSSGLVIGIGFFLKVVFLGFVVLWF